MTDKHTPGPWLQSHRKQPDGMYITQVYDANGETIADLSWFPVKLGCVTVTSRGANARLIAAAPDLAAELEYVVSYFEGGIMPLDLREWKLRASVALKKLHVDGN